MKRFTLLASALVVAAMLLVAGGPATESAEARTCWKVKHPRDAGYAVGCNDNRMTACDYQDDNHDTWVRYWKLQPSDPEGLPGDNKNGFLPGNASSSAHDIFGRRTRQGRRVPNWCTPDTNLGFGIAAIAVCVSREGCSKPLPLHTAQGRIPG